MKSGLNKFLATALFVVTIPSIISAQTEGSSPLPKPGNSVVADRFTGSITVYLRSENELPISATPQITLTSETDYTVIPEFPRLVGEGWVFTGLPIGATYDLDISVLGYQPVHETAEISAAALATVNVVVNLRPTDQQFVFHPPAGQFVLAPHAQKEVERGLRDLSSNKVVSAQKHFQKAIELAPGNPYVNYVTGMSYVMAKQELKARPYLEESVSLDPTQAASLLALGTVRFDQGNYPGAIDLLTKAVKLDPSSWKSEWLLASACLRQGDFLLARDHAEKALAAGKEKAEPVKLVLAEARSGLGDRSGALVAVNSFLSNHPTDPNALKLRAWLTSLPGRSPMTENTAIKAAPRPAATVPQPKSFAVHAPQPTADLPPKPDWAPPDIDAERPLIASSAVCSLSKILRVAGKTAGQMVTDLQRFTANEKYEAVEIKRDRDLERPETQTFSYLMFIEKPRPDIIDVQEVRDQGTSAAGMPGQFADSDAALALVFHPLLERNFAWSCEGLGEWQGKPVWVVRFEQRVDRPNYLATFQDGLKSVPLPLKGRAWISESGGEVIHLETDLVSPVPEIKLQREHSIIDYKAVTFPKHKVTLWLPENVDVYLQYHGHYLHHYHHFSDFHLFWTSATQKIGQPSAEAKSD